MTRPAAALAISAGAVHYTPRPMAPGDLALVRQIDAFHPDFAFAGTRMLRRRLRADFPGVGRRRMGTLMLHMGIAAVSPQPGTSRRRRAHPIFPYLLRHRTITRPNEVWAMAITYIPMAHGFCISRRSWIWPVAAC